MMLSILVASAVIGGAQPAQPEAAPQVTEAERARREAARDRVQYEALIREIRKIDRRYDDAVNAAMSEARQAEDGQASLTGQADLLALRDRRDRLTNRLMLLSLRHGWQTPDFDAAPADIEDDSAQGKKQIFAASTAVLQERFEREAEHAARLVHLPVVPLIVER